MVPLLVYAIDTMSFDHIYSTINEFPPLKQASNLVNRVMNLTKTYIGEGVQGGLEGQS